jgi:hypothetical protein
MEIQELAKHIVAELVSSGALAKAINSANAVTSAPARCPNFKPKNPENSTGDYTDDQKLKFSLRGDCMNLVERIIEKHNIDKKTIFIELKRRTGVSQPEANQQQLSERVDLLQRWLKEGRL